MFLKECSNETPQDDVNKQNRTEKKCSDKK